MTTIFISIGIFLSMILLIEGAYYCYHKYFSPQQQTLKRRLRGGTVRQRESQKVEETASILRERKLSDLPWLNDLLTSMKNLGGLEKLLQQANSQTPVGVFLLLSGVLGLVAAVIAGVLDYELWIALLCGLIGMILPWAQVKWQRARRFKAFEAQLPEALDLMARALRAGHAFSVGMKMVGDEFPDPIGPEFNRTVEEISYGIDVPEAMSNLNQRVVSTDLKFFITALVVQRETGGNLAEIIEAIARLIRQRFELLGRVAALSAEGRLSALVLFLLPIVMAGVLYYINEAYMSILFTDPVGKLLLMAACGLMVVGMFVIRKLVNFKV